MGACGEGRLAVALHDVHPRTYERCALIRDWLCDLGVERATLLVVPAADLRPFDHRSPALAEWLAERRAAGDAVAQQGFRGTAPPRGEFAHLDRGDTSGVLAAGRHVLRLAGVDASGFVAPRYAYTPALLAVLPAAFEWWAGSRAVHHAGGILARAPALSAARLAGGSRLRRRPALSGELVRIDLHPGDLDRRRNVAVLERVLEQARERVAVTYDALVDTV